MGSALQRLQPTPVSLLLPRLLLLTITSSVVLCVGVPALLRSLADIFSAKPAFERITEHIEKAFTDTSQWQSGTEQMNQEIVNAIKPDICADLDIERNSYRQTMGKVRCEFNTRRVVTLHVDI